MSEQDWAEKAANEIVCDLEKLYGSMYSGATRKEWVTKYANIIRSAPSSDLVGVVQDTIAWLEEISTVPHNSDCDSLNVANYADEDNECDCFHRGRRLILQLLRRAALSAQEPKVCEWEKYVLNDSGYYYYKTTCGADPEYGANETIDYKFCPYCGGVIKVKESDK